MKDIIRVGSRIAEGATAEVFGLGQSRVVKLYYKNEDANCADLEYKNSIALWQSGIPTPRPFERIEIDNRPGIVYERINSINFMNVLFQGCESQTRKMIQFIYKFHQIEPLQYPAFNNLRTVETNIYINLQRLSSLTDNEKAQAMSIFKGLPDTHKLCHGDFNPTNILLKNNKLMVIDLISLSVGNPLFDVMEELLIWKYKVLPDRFPQELRYQFNMNRKLILDTFVDEYLRLSNISKKDLMAWFVPVAAVHLITDVGQEEKSAIIRDIRKELTEPGSLIL